MIDPGLVKESASEGLAYLREAHSRITGREFDAIIGKKIEKWEKDTKSQLENVFPYKEEERNLENSEHDFRDGLSQIDSLTDDVQNYMKSSPESAGKYLEEINNLDSARLSEIHSNLIVEWRREFDRKTVEWTLKALETRRNALVGSLDKWLALLEAASKASEVFGLGKGVLWDLMPGNISEQDSETIRQWSEAFGKDPNIRRLCEILGRACSFSREYETERRVPIEDTASVPDYSSKEELIGVEMGNRIEDLVPSEIGLMNDPDTELLFDLKYAEKRLLCFSKQGYLEIGWDTEDNVSLTDEKRFAGPVIFCIDTSGSMQGTPEYVAKAITFYLAFRAHSENRSSFLINFSTDIDYLNLTPSKGLKELSKFLSMSFHGGTDIKPALDLAVQTLDEEEYSDADVIVISDFVMPRNSFKYLTKDVRHAKEKGCKFHSLSIGNFRYVPDLSEIFDECWHYEPSTGKVEVLKNN